MKVRYRHKDTKVVRSDTEWIAAFMQHFQLSYQKAKVHFNKLVMKGELVQHG